MNENLIPKWQRELRSFLGIKKGIILEGNVYDEYPYFDYSNREIEFLDIDNIDQTIISVVDTENTDVIFFDPVDGFYCYEDSVETQSQMIEPYLKGYLTNTVYKNHDCTICFMPSAKKDSSKETPDANRYIWVSEIIRRAMSDNSDYSNKDNVVFVLNYASRLDAGNTSDSISNTMFLNLMAATTAGQTSQRFCNSLVMIVDKYNDIPAWVYLNNSNIRPISVGVPDRSVRKMYLENLCGESVEYKQLSDKDFAPGKKFLAETEGMRLQELKQIITLAYRMGIKSENIDLAFRLYKYGVTDNPWETLEKDIIVHTEKKLDERVKGQKDALDKVKAVVAMAVKGLSGLQHSGASHPPKGVLFFAGPTGVGKTETAKALAEAIFGDENACIRFDMSEYRSDESDQKLFGAPPGYIGYEGGGQLTNAVKTRPFSILLFDEIEKAAPSILDKFLQILEDGRMTDNQGNTVYFGESIIIFTSNIGMTKEKEGNVFFPSKEKELTIKIEDPETEDTPEFREKVTKTLTDGVKQHFLNIGRPELLNRIGEDNIVVFQFINKSDAETICDYKLDKICKAIRAEKNIIIYTDDIKPLLRKKAVLERKNGGRGVGNMLQRDFIKPLAGFICTLEELPLALRCYTDNEKIEFEVL